MSTFERINKFLDEYGVKADNEEQSFDDLRMDSLDVLELLIELEGEFEIEIPDEDVEGKIKTVKDAVAYIDKRLAEK